MDRLRNEHTIAAACEIRGRGYWSGRDVTVTIRPAPPGSGVTLLRTDRPDRPTCPATIGHRVDASLRTNLSNGAASFEMVEHLMAALSALEIDNCVVEVDGEELPGLDGSSLAYVDALAAAGLIIQARSRNRLRIDSTYRVGVGSSWIEAAPAIGDECYFEYQLGFDDDTPIVPQAYSISLTPGRFAREIAPARTFVTQEQAAKIRAAGLAAHVGNADLVVIGDDGPVDNAFRFANECARHKLLDLIGDLALAGVELVGRFTSYRGGHSLNGKVARQLARMAGQRTDDQSRFDSRAATCRNFYRRRRAA